MEQILVWLDGIQVINGVEFTCKKQWLINVVDEGDEVGLYFAKGDGSNGKGFIKMPIDQKKALLKACEA